MAKRKTKPKIEIDLAKVEVMAANGLTQQQIADSLGISVSTLYGRKRENEEFEEAIKRGKAKGIAVVTNELMKQVKSGNVTAMIFFLKARAGWKEKNELDLTNSDGSFSQPRSLKDLFADESEIKPEAEATD
ncbi:phBC6A51 family helix-turn-helix protein [Haemophilus parahaemolyticus]|jgi:hypothetical protein|uniref:phBC6A51 family helix-turn-helix protein n=1 Tax=Haemophilus parahaemolyticus TaxID=735 RepID=UPI00204B30FB|nr:phBC6A51 family helix-turn-helix protein [Haemophilus parahaemolyticus]DAW07741.1 MAG TPA: terminase small subunit [Caudoviricetes sp.]